MSIGTIDDECGISITMIMVRKINMILIVALKIYFGLIMNIYLITMIAMLLNVSLERSCL